MKTKEDLVCDALAKLAELGTIGAMKWLADEIEALYRPRYGAAGHYQEAGPTEKSMIDAAIANADALISVSRGSRDRRKLDMPFQANGLPDRRQQDRRSIFRNAAQNDRDDDSPTEFIK